MAANRGLLKYENVIHLPSVSRFTAPNPGPKTLGGTHTYVAGHHSAYVIDPGPTRPEYQGALASELAATGCFCRGILLTHGHPDHAPGAALLSQLLGAPILASEILDTAFFETTPEVETLQDGQRLSIDGDTLSVIASPGHSADHLAFFLEGARILFSGDTILGYGSTLVAPPEGDMIDYMHTLDRLRALDARMIAPSHGPLIHHPAAKIDEYIQHRRERERQILAALAHDSLTIDELVTRLYVGVEEELRPLAAASVAAQLEKLAAEGEVTNAPEGYWRVAR